MNFKTKFTKLILIFFSLVLLLSANNSITFAQGIDFKCGDLNNQNEGALKDLLVVINEEPLGENITDIPGSGIKRCDRGTHCTWMYSSDGKSGKWDCISKYVEKGSCQNTPKPGFNADGTPKETSYFRCDPVQAYVAHSGPDLLFSYIAQIYRYAAITGGVVSVMFLIFGGLMIAASGDNSEAVGKGKAIIVRSISGIILLFLSALILYTVNPNFFTI
jgi:hypothetical protein